MNKTANDGFFPTAIEQPSKHENQAKFLHRQIVPLNEQNHNLKDYIIAMNYYLSSRCKDFSSVLRINPQRQLIIQMADLVSIYELVKEDIEYYKNQIKELENDHIGMKESVQRMSQREQYCKISCSAKIEEVLAEIEELKKEQACQLEQQRKYLTKKYEDCEQLLQSEVSAHQAKQNEFYRISELNNAYKKQITKQYDDFQKEIQSLEGMLARQKEKYNRDVKALREKNENDLKDKQKESDTVLEELRVETEAQVNQYKTSWMKTQQDYLLVKNELDRQLQILNRTKAVLEMSQNDIREQNQKIKDLEELVLNQSNQISTLQGDISCKNQAIEQLENQVQNLNESLRKAQEESQLINLKWIGVMRNLLFEVNTMGKDLDLPVVSVKSIDCETYTLCFERFRAADTLMRRYLRENESLKEYNFSLSSDLQEAERRIQFAKDLKQKEIAEWINKFQKLLDKSKSIIRRQDKEALLLKILRKNHQNVIKKLKHENRELITELRKIKSMKYEELTSEMIYIKNQRQLYKLEAEMGTFPSDDEKKEKLPWYLIEAVSDNTDEDPQDFAEEVLGQQNALIKVPTDPDFQMGKNYLCIACHEIFLSHQVVEKPEQIKDVKEVLIPDNQGVKPLPKFILKEQKETKEKNNQRQPVPAFRINPQVQINHSKVNQPSLFKEEQTDRTERFATSQGSRNKIEEKKLEETPIQSQIDNVKLYAKKTKVKKAQPSFKSPQWQLQHEVEVTAPQSEIRSFSSQKIDTFRGKEQMVVADEDFFLMGVNDRISQQDVTRVSSRQARRSSQPQAKTIPEQETPPQLYSQRDGFEPQIVAGAEIQKSQPQINDLNLNRVSVTPNQFWENQSSSGRPPSIVSNRSLEQVVRSIRMKKLNKEDPIEKVPSIMYTIEQQEQNDDLNKSIQAQVQCKTVWVQTDRRDGEDPEVLQARYIEIIKDMEKRQKHTLNSLKQREEERLKELHLRQLKLAELTTHMEDHEAKAKLFSAKCDSLQVLNQNLEAKLVQESNLVKQLRDDIQHSEEQYEIKMNNAILDAITKENQLKGIIQNLNFNIESKISEIQELKRLYNSEVEGRAIDNEKHLIFQEQERQRFNGIIEGLEGKLSEQKQKEKEIILQLKQMNEYLSTRPARPEDVSLIDQLRKEGQKLEQSLFENHRILLHANEIVKYLQLELENYKQMYNLFQQGRNDGQEQINIENMRQKVFGLAYQKQFLQMLELQKQIIQEEDQSQPYHNSKASMRPTTTQQKQFNQTQRTSYLPKVDEMMNRTKTRRSKYENLNQSVGDIQVSSSKKATPAQMRRQFEDTCQVSTAKPIFPKPADQSLRRNQISPCFTNPFENDNILMHAENFIKNLNSSPNTRNSKRIDENGSQNVKTTKSNEIDNDQFQQIAEFKQFVQRYEQP